MGTAKGLMPLIFSNMVIFGPVLGKRIGNSNTFENDQDEVFSKFDGVWAYGDELVTIREGKLIRDDGVSFPVQVHLAKRHTQNDILKVFFPPQTYEAYLDYYEDRIFNLMNDQRWFTRVKDKKISTTTRPANVNVLSPYQPLNVPNGHPAARFRSINPSMQMGGPGLALIPELEPPPGFVYEFKNIEKTREAQFFFEGIDTNEYKWEFDEIESMLDGAKFKIDQKFAVLKGKWQSNSFGHQSVHVHNANGDEMFKIRSAKHRLNPFKLRWSFRILPPGSKSNKDAIFTIIKDYFGKGFMWMKEEWRIYRGRKRNKDMIYYCIGNYINWDFKFYRNKDAYDSGNGQVVAKIEQKRNAGAIINHNFLPDKFKLKVYPGEDSALLLAVSSIIDMTHDATGSQGFRPSYHHGYGYHHGHHHYH